MSIDPYAVREFLPRIRAAGLLNLVAIHPEAGAPEARTFEMPAEAHAAASWACERNAEGWNCYFTVNPVKDRIDKKPSKSDVAGVEWLYADIDPDVTNGYDAGRAALLTETLPLLQEGRTVPTASLVIDTGNGLGAFWAPDRALDTETGESLTRRLTSACGGDKAVWSADHLMRLPGTMNYPTQRKLEKGYPSEPRPAAVVFDSGRVCATEDLDSTLAPDPHLNLNSAAGNRDWDKIDIYGEGPIDIGDRLMGLIDSNLAFRDTWERRRKLTSQSDYDFSLAVMALKAGWSPPEVAELIRMHRGNDEKSGRDDYLNRTIARALDRVEQTRATNVFSPLPEVTAPDSSLRGCQRDGSQPASSVSAEQISQDIFLLPSNHTQITESAQGIFPVLAAAKRLFIHGGAIVEVGNRDGQQVLMQVDEQAFRSRIEKYGRPLMAYVQYKGEPVLMHKLCTAESAKGLMASSEAAEHLPHIRAVLDCPIITPDLNVLGVGYHAYNGGLLITQGTEPPSVYLEEAVQGLLGLLRDYEFATPADRSRAVAMLITPLLKMGGFLRGPTPIDVAEADKSQAGKTTRQKAVAALYGGPAAMVTKTSGGVGSVDESIGSALATGKPFIQLDNFRGVLDSAFLEAAVTSPENVPVRVPHKATQHIDARIVTFQLSSNGVNATRDLANRSCIVRIRKRQRNNWTKYPEGGYLEHIRANQAYYLGCVFAVIREWARQGCQRTDSTEHDMVDWAQALDWIVQNLFGLPRLLEGHRRVQDEVSQPTLMWLRQVCIEAENAGKLGQDLRAHDLSELCEEHGIDWPNPRIYLDNAAANQYVGKLLGQAFRNAEGEQIELDSYTMTRTTVSEHDFANRTPRERKSYVITRRLEDIPAWLT